MSATAQSDVLDVTLIASSGEAFATKKRVSFIFRGNVKQLESYIYNVSQMYSFRVECIVSIYDVNAGKYICKLGGLE